MAGMAKSTGKLTIIHVNNKEQFIKSMNDTLPPKEFWESCRKAKDIFDKPLPDTESFGKEEIIDE